MDMNDIGQILEQFLQMEKDKKLFEMIEINHIKIWHYVRYEIYNMVLQSLNNFQNPNQGKVSFIDSKAWQDWLDEWIMKNQFLISQKDVLIFNHSRRVKQGNYYKCIYTDEWLKQFDKSYYVFENKYKGQMHFRPIRTKNLRYIDMQKYKKLFRKRYDIKGYNKEITSVTEKIAELLENEFQVSWGYKYRKKISTLITNILAGREIDKDYYLYLIKKIQPKIIMYVVGYSLDNMIIAELGKELGIPTVEIEHGHIGRGHLAYNFKVNTELQALPEYLFVTGQHEVDTMRIPISDKNIYVVGSPELDAKVKYYSEKLSYRKRKKKIITLMSSGEYEIADMAVELSRRLNSEEYAIYLKLHPGEYTNWKKKYKNLKDSNVQVVDDSRHDTYYYLAISDFIIGIASTVLFEATRFSCNIMVLKAGRYLNSESLIQRGQGIYIESIDDAVRQISGNQNTKRVDDYFYCKNSCQRMYNAINTIMNDKKKSRHIEV